MIEVVATGLIDVKLIKPHLFEDERGFFFESYNKRTFLQAGIETDFVQDNHSRSLKNTLRGLHYQLRNIQGKLVRPLIGTIFDVAVDMRMGSPTFGKWAAVTLDAADKTMLWIPPGFAHGFLVISDYAEVLYKTTDYYDPKSEQCLSWNYDTAIPWPINGTPLLSEKDSKGLPLAKLNPIMINQA